MSARAFFFFFTHSINTLFPSGHPRPQLKLFQLIQKRYLVALRTVQLGDSREIILAEMDTILRSLDAARGGDWAAFPAPEGSVLFLNEEDSLNNIKVD